ncbi:hypothetical protein GCM10023091_41180 [Ravibacter arvi]|uniref:6-phosphogluconate dehydrogenase n=1 Tax=Ravibacter arvi TaxID=2051041 RepID=A0ABP8MC50_9BACT
MRKWTFLIIFLALLLGILYYISFGSYSEGRRAGFVLKLSKKGYVFKTYEGELRIGGLYDGEGTMNATEWAFSVASNNQEAIKKLEEAIATGQRASLTYEEKFFVLPWNGDTKFFITDVEVLRSGPGIMPYQNGVVPNPATPEDTTPRQTPADTTAVTL